jgi:hypothetical protein
MDRTLNQVRNSIKLLQQPPEERPAAETSEQ